MKIETKKWGIANLIMIGWCISFVLFKKFTVVVTFLFFGTLLIYFLLELFLKEEK